MSVSGALNRRPAQHRSQEKASGRGRPPTGRQPVPPTTLWGRALAAVIGLGTLPVLFLWWQDTIPGSLGDAADCVVAAARICGLLAAYLLLVLVALMARVPWLENRVGSDTVARTHRALGEYTVVLAVVHAALVITGYAWQAHTSPLGETVTVVADYTDVWMSAVALGLLLLVGVVSARAVRRRMRYEHWYHLHLLVYLAIGLAFSHEFAVGTDFSTSLRNRLLWSGAHVLVAAALVLFRVLLPLARSLRHRVRVARVVPEGPGVVSVHLTGVRLDRLGARPGQFLRWRFLAPGQWWQSHPYSLSAAPGGHGLRITVKALGDGSGSLARLRPGTRVLFEGPYGAFTARAGAASGGRDGTGRTARRVLLIAGGSGITPVRALFEALPGGPGDVDLLYRASTEADLVLRQELEAIASASGYRLHLHVGPRGSAADPLRADELRRLVPDVAERDVYVCGPAGLTAAAHAALRGAGVPARRIRTEAFTL